MKRTLAGAAVGVALAVGGTAALADGPVCSKAKLSGIAAQHTIALPDGGVLEGWFGTGHGVAPADKTGGKPTEGDAACQAKTFGELESVCLKEWKKSYCP